MKVMHRHDYEPDRLDSRALKRWEKYHPLRASPKSPIVRLLGASSAFSLSRYSPSQGLPFGADSQHLSHTSDVTRQNSKLVLRLLAEALIIGIMREIIIYTSR
jgi:hypothetical protein